MEMTFPKIFGETAIDVNKNNVGSVLETLVSHGARNPHGYGAGAVDVSRLVTAAKENGFIEELNKAAGDKLAKLASGLGNGQAGRSFPEIGRDQAQEKVLLQGLVQGKAQLGRIVSEEYAWRRMSEWSVPALTEAFAGYTKHIDRATTSAKVAEHAASFVGAVVFADRHAGMSKDYNPLKPLETTRALLPHHLQLAVTDGVGRKAYDVARENGDYGQDKLKLLAKNSDTFRQAINDGIDSGAQSRRYSLGQGGTSGRQTVHYTA